MHTYLFRWNRVSGNKRNDHKKVQVEKVFYAHENRDFSESDTYRDGDTADKAYRRRHMAGQHFLQRFSENGRFFYLSSWQIFRPGAAYPDHSDVYRRFAGFYGRRHKDQYIFVLLQGIKASATNKMEEAFHYSVPKDAFRKASVIALIAVGVIFIGTYLMVLMEPEITLMDAILRLQVRLALWDCQRA